MESHVMIDPNDRNVVDALYASTTCLPTQSKQIPDDMRKNYSTVAVREFMNIIVLSVSFTLTYITYLSLQILQSSLNQTAGLGVLCLSLLYGISLVSSFITPIVISLIGVKATFVVSWCIFAIYTGANFFPTWETFIPASLLLGVMINPLWASHATYIAQRASNYASLTGKKIANVLMQFNGIFFTMYNFSQVLGNLVSSLVLNRDTSSHVNVSHFHENDQILYPICGASDCPSPDVAQNTTVHVAEPRTVSILLGTFLSLNIICLMITCAFLQPLMKTPRQPNRMIIASCCRMAFTDIKLILVLPLCMAETIFQGFIYAEFTKSYVTCSLGVGMVGFVLATFGGTATLSAFLQSYVARYTGRVPLIIAVTLLQGSTRPSVVRRSMVWALIMSEVTVLIVLFWWYPSPEEIYVFFTIAAVVGIAEGTWPSQTLSLFSLVFRDKLDQAFTNINAVKSIGFSVTFLMSAFFCTSTKILASLVLLIVGVALHITAEFLYSREKNSPPSNDEKTPLPELTTVAVADSDAFVKKVADVSDMHHLMEEQHTSQCA